MSASILYRIASVLLVLFAAGHQLGFRRTKPAWGVDAVVASMQTTRFDVDGFSRTYWDFFSGFGFFVTVLLLFAAVLCWQLGGLGAEQLWSLRIVTWALALCFVLLAVFTWRYFFLVPGVFSSVVAACLVLAAWLAGNSTITV
jgi:hypothetical protein